MQDIRKSMKSDKVGNWKNQEINEVENQKKS